MMPGRPHANNLVLGLLVGVLALGSAGLVRAQVESTKDDTKKADPGTKASGNTGASVAVKPIVSSGPATRPGVDRSSVFRLLLHANPMLWPLAICSIVTLGYVMERFAALRRERVIPQEFVERFLERLASGKLDRERAFELCRAHESPAARVFSLVVNAWGQPGLNIRQIVSHDAAGEVVELKRNLRVLSAMSTLGPLLGLLGTVVGIIQSFDALGGRLGAARGEAAGARDQPGAGRHGIRTGNRHRCCDVLLLFPQSGRSPGARTGRPDAAGDRIGLQRNASSAAGRSAPRADRRWRHPPSGVARDLKPGASPPRARLPMISGLSRRAPPLRR